MHSVTHFISGRHYIHCTPDSLSSFYMDRAHQTDRQTMPQHEADYSSITATCIKQDITEYLGLSSGFMCNNYFCMQYAAIIAGFQTC